MNWIAPSFSTAYRSSPSEVVKIATTLPVLLLPLATLSPIANLAIEVPLVPTRELSLVAVGADQGATLKNAINLSCRILHSMCKGFANSTSWEKHGSAAIDAGTWHRGHGVNAAAAVFTRVLPLSRALFASCSLRACVRRCRTRA